MTATIIAAHDEANVIGRCLDAIQHGAMCDEFEVIVAANGCSDGTAAEAKSRKSG
jgi:glycosyltransferase involved in cell wall biosynthesis